MYIFKIKQIPFYFCAINNIIIRTRTEWYAICVWAKLETNA